jgi:hypothetical protein
MDSFAGVFYRVYPKHCPPGISFANQQIRFPYNYKISTQITLAVGTGKADYY